MKLAYFAASVATMAAIAPASAAQIIHVAGSAGAHTGSASPLPGTSVDITFGTTSMYYTTYDNIRYSLSGSAIGYTNLQYGGISYNDSTHGAELVVNLSNYTSYLIDYTYYSVTILLKPWIGDGFPTSDYYSLTNVETASISVRDLHYRQDISGYETSALAIYDLDLSTVDARGTPPTPVPESATWALMVLGFGLVGTAARRQRRLHAA